MERDTREKLLLGAKLLFAEKGFYGASLSQVAGEVGVTKQALLYHFKRKEDLYAAVLQEISQRLLRYVHASVRRTASPEQQFEDVVLGLYSASREYPEDTMILVRELLDNQTRAETARDWYLSPFLGEFVAILKRIPGFEEVSDASAFCMVYQLAGCVEYFAISRATLTRMYGKETYESFRDVFPMELRAQLRRLLRDHMLAAAP